MDCSATVASSMWGRMVAAGWSSSMRALSAAENSAKAWAGWRRSWLAAARKAALVWALRSLFSFALCSSRLIRSALDSSQNSRSGL